jgi:hypothetical protein
VDHRTIEEEDVLRKEIDLHRAIDLKNKEEILAEMLLAEIEVAASVVQNPKIKSRSCLLNQSR